MFEDIRLKIQDLIARYESERVRADALESELESRKSELESCHEQIIELQDQIEILRLKGAFGAGDSGTATSSKEIIDDLIREIDKCISLLSS